MSNFLVLGLIPGTDFQINFSMWLGLTALLLALLTLRLLRTPIISVRIALTIFSAALVKRNYAA